jgi:hypothetical protein
MQGFDPVFKRGNEEFHALLNSKSEEEIFQSFHSFWNVYGFIHNQDTPPDEEAIAVAKSVNEELYNTYLLRNKNKKLLGLVGYGTQYADYNQLDSRHIMMSVILFSKIPEAPSTIVEIGGGYGNWIRLNSGVQSFKKWTIVDLPYVNKLQAWYLKNHEIPEDTYEIVSANGYKDKQLAPDLVIGAHSMSEFSRDIFVDYVSNIVCKSKYFFYAYHKYSPSKELIDKKLAYLDMFFEPIFSVDSEGGNVANTLYRRI